MDTVPGRLCAAEARRPGARVACRLPTPGGEEGRAGGAGARLAVVGVKGHPKTGVPRANTVIVSLFRGVLAACIPLGRRADATRVGTLFAFALVNVAVVVLRRTRPDMRRTFRVPPSPVLPAIGFAPCVWTMGSLSAVTWVVFGVWIAVGLVFYFSYGCRRSHIATVEK